MHACVSQKSCFSDVVEIQFLLSKGKLFGNVSITPRKTVLTFGKCFVKNSHKVVLCLSRTNDLRALLSAYMISETHVEEIPASSCSIEKLDLSSSIAFRGWGLCVQKRSSGEVKWQSEKKAMC